MKTFFKKYWYVGLGLLIAFGLIGVFTHASLTNNSISESSGQKSYKLTIALVNEDEGGAFHDVDYNFGNDFVNMITKDKGNNWIVTSRNIAESGLRHKNYEMVLIIPNNFTTRTLQLESNNPKQAELQYEVNTSKNPQIRSQAQEKVAALLQLFNRRVINMYFSSVVNNLHTAQTNVGSMINREAYLNGDLLNNVNKPFQGLDGNFSAVTDQSNNIQDSYNDWQDQADQFNDEAKSSMNDTIKNGKDSLQSIEEFGASQNQQMAGNKKTVGDYYTKSITIEKDLLDTDHQKLLVNDTKSKDAYQGQYEKYTQELNKIRTDQFGQFRDLKSDLLDVQGQDTALQSLINANNSLRPAIAEMNQQHDNETQVLNDELTQLQEDQTNLHQFFTGSGTGDLSNTGEIKNYLKQTIADALRRNPDLKKSQTGNKDREVMTDYLNRTVGSADANVASAIDWLTFAGGLPQDQAAEYEHDAALVEKYARDHHIKQPNTTAVKAIKTVVSKDVGINVQNDMTFTLPEMKTGDKTLLTFNKPNDLDLDLSTLATLIDAEGDGNIHATVAKDSSAKTGKITITAVKDLLDTKGSDGALQQNTNRLINISSSDLNRENILTFEPSHFSNSLLLNSPASLHYTMNNNKTGQKISDDAITLTYVNNDASTDVMQMVSQSDKMLYQVAQAGAVISAYYGADTENDELKTSESSDTLEHQASSKSVYKQMNDDDYIDTIADLVASHLVGQFQVQAQQADRQITMECQSLQNQIDNDGYAAAEANTIAKLTAANEAIAQKGKVLMAWYEEARRYSHLIDVPIFNQLDLDETSVAFKPEKQPELADDQTTGPELIKTIKAQLTDSQNTVNETIADSAKVKDMTPSFERLKSSTEKLSGTSKAIVNNASTLAATWSGTIAKNGDFSKGFNKVLANTKKGNDDNQKVYDYLSNPVKMKNTGEISDNTSILPYYLVLINLFTTLFTAYVLSLLEKRRKVRSADRFRNVHNIAWKNLPWTLIIGSVGIAEGLLIGMLSRRLLQTNQISMMTWLLTSMLIQVALLSATTYLLRQANAIGMAVVMMFSALYLFFTPSLGIKVASGSLTKQFMMFSPLQYVENIYTRLTTGVGLNSVSYVTITIIALVVTVLNLFVYKRKSAVAKGVSNDETPAIG